MNNDRVIIYADDYGRWRWRRVNGRGITIAAGTSASDSPEHYDCCYEAARVNREPYVLEVQLPSGAVSFVEQGLDAPTE